MNRTTTRNGRARRRVAAAAATLTLATIGASCVPPDGGPVSTDPVLNVDERAAFVVGSQISTTSNGDPDDLTTSGFTSSIQADVSWTSSDDTAICGHDVEQVYAGSAPGLVLDNSLDTQYVDSETDYDDQFGGGSSKIMGWNVTARDCEGNTTTKFVGGGPVVIQEDGTTAGYGDQPPAYTGTWGTSSCTCWSHGKVARTTEAGATVSHTVGDGDGRISLVMEQAPNRGRFSVAINGVQQDVVDNGLVPTARQRVVVWESEVEPGDVVTVTNLATSGRPRIDLDAIVLR